ncbi:uncharacterized protein ASCRUDRAFT_8842 [Ascoidea rubescens DSM 1968]|uniref:Uncharacterized protein n=1 Tax=Ascoidea rubescens DSM 1968 TaxID=1344418 RepID=A0A1D2VEE0_9ASCO|nr:hypothetical protein ASCRUDRAFT_8842 [Ascoidea rubescens DSM 1968]ODV60068.1 hypothetical protein ASCRUDRAFT_8842 [Ascoidea rubescens DSM 1968]
MFEHLLNEKGMFHEFTALNSSSQNKDAEESLRQIRTNMRQLLIESSIPSHYGTLAIIHLIYLLSYLPSIDKSVIKLSSIVLFNTGLEIDSIHQNYNRIATWDMSLQELNQLYANRSICYC